MANPNIVNSDIVSSDIANSDIANSDFVKMNPITLPAEMSSDIQSATHTITTSPMDLIPSDWTETPEEHRDPPPTLQTLPAEMLLEVAEYLSPPQRVSLALASKSVLYAAGLPPSSAWRAWRREVSNSPFLPWYLRFPAAQSFVDRKKREYLDNKGHSEYAGDGARVVREVRWSLCSWNGNLVMETEIGFDVVNNGPGAAAAAVARLFRQDPDPSENPVGFPLEGPLDWCCPHVRWLEAFPHAVATSPSRAYEFEPPKICNRCTTAYRCDETRDGSSRRFRFESRRVLGRCQTVTDPMWLSQATQDYPPKSELVAEGWKTLWPEAYTEPLKIKTEEESPIQPPRWGKCVATRNTEFRRAQAEGRLESPQPRMLSWGQLEDWPILLNGLDAWAVQRYG